MIQLKFKEPINDKNVCLEIPKEYEEKFRKSIGLDSKYCSEIEVIFQNLESTILEVFNIWCQYIWEIESLCKKYTTDFIVNIDGHDSYILTDVAPTMFAYLNFIGYYKDKSIILKLHWNYRHMVCKENL